MNIRYCFVYILIIINALILLQCTATLTTVYYRQQWNGNIFSLSSHKKDNAFVMSSTTPDTDNFAEEVEYFGTNTSTRYLGLAYSHLQSKLYYSTGTNLKSVNLDGTNIEVVVGSLVRVQWVGLNFGVKMSDITKLTVRKRPCMDGLKWSATTVECLVGLTTEESKELIPDDCVIETINGQAKGIDPNYLDKIAAGFVLPLVMDIKFIATRLLPHALAFDNVPIITHTQTSGVTCTEKRDTALYWSNSANGAIYRSGLDDGSLTVIARNLWGVKGLCVGRDLSMSSGTICEMRANRVLYVSVEGKGHIYQINLSSSKKLLHEQFQRHLILSNLKAPRGLAIDHDRKNMYYTEKTGRIYRVDLTPLQSLGSFESQSVNKISESENEPILNKYETKLVILRPTLARLDGLAVDSQYIYWCETNTNIIAKASLRSFIVEHVVETSLTWPRSIVLISDGSDINVAQHSFIFTEYVGRISFGSTLKLVVTELEDSMIQNLDELIKASSHPNIRHRHMYALE